MLNSTIRLANDASNNHLLACLPAATRAAWLGHLELVDLELGHVLHEAQTRITQVYFPLTAIVSLLHVTENGSLAEIALIGNEGMVGFALIMGGETTPSRAVVQGAGVGFRMTARFIKPEFNLVPPVMHLMLRFTQELITQMAQTAVCNRHHSLQQQLCRRLLPTLDRLRDGRLLMTQEQIANMLGVRREGVTECAGELQEAGLIRYARGRITVLDRSGLERRACECYEMVRKEYHRLLPDRTAT